MRVLLFSHSSAVENLGGAERTLLELIDAWVMVDPAVEFFVIARSPVGHLQPELDRRGIRWMILPFTSTVTHRRVENPGDVYAAARDDFTAVRAIERFIREYRPSLVLTNTIVAPWAAIAARLAPTPHVWYAHEYGDGHEYQIPRDDIFTDIGLLSDLVVASSESLRDFLSEWISRDRIAVAYPAVRSDVQTPDRTPAIWPVSAAPDPADLRVVCVARIMPSKGQTRLVRAIAELRGEGTRVEVAFVGSADDAHRHELLSLAAELGVADQIALTGELDDPSGIIALADIGAVVSDSEGFGRVTVEYMLAGKPVVGAAVGATPELVVDGRTGRLFSLDAPHGLAEALRFYAVNAQLVAAHGATAARVARDEIVRRHTLVALAQRLVEIAGSDPRPLDRLPRIMVAWLAMPEVVYRYVAESGAAVRLESTRTWRLGRMALSIPRRIRRILRPERSTR